MPSSFDQFMPQTRLQFPDGSVLSVGTVSCDDQIHQAVYLSFAAAGSATPTMELELPPKTIEVIIDQLQEHANQARFINGDPMLEYPQPYPAASRGSSRRTSKAHPKKKELGQQDPAPNSRPPRQSKMSSEVQTPDSQRTPSSGGCG